MYVANYTIMYSWLHWLWNCGTYISTCELKGNYVRILLTLYCNNIAVLNYVT